MSEKKESMFGASHYCYFLFFFFFFWKGETRAWNKSRFELRKGVVEFVRVLTAYININLCSLPCLITSIMLSNKYYLLPAQRTSKVVGNLRERGTCKNIIIKSNALQSTEKLPTNQPRVVLLTIDFRLSDVSKSSRQDNSIARRTRTQAAWRERKTVRGDRRVY